MVGAVGLVITIGLSWAARSAHADNEDRLTRQRTLEASAVLTVAIPTIEVPLATAAALTEAGSADPALFRTAMGPQVGPKLRFTSASLWSMKDLTRVVQIGDPPALASRGPEKIRAFFERSMRTPGLSVLDLLDRSRPRLGYSYTLRAGRFDYLVYAEQALPPNRTAVVQRDSAFDGLRYALYLRTPERANSLLVASTRRLPLRGRTATETSAFGDSKLQLVISPTGTLGGSLLARLAWLVLAAGVGMTAAAAILTERLVQRRRHAEVLAEDNAALYAEQRAASLLLQQSLLPRRLPDVADLDIAVRYAPGVSGTEVGGDWYDVIDLGDRTALVVGDVSGRGLEAASVMAAVRHAVRAHLFDGEGPDTVLQKVNRRDAFDLYGHFVTVLIAVIDRPSSSLLVATAGHPPPIVVRGSESEVVAVPVGRPIGVSGGGGGEYACVAAALPTGGAIVLCTDGVFERRGETIDAGLERLRASTERPKGSASDYVDAIFEDLAAGSGRDDAAVLVVRWTA